jgi:hypothetical protein
MENYGDQYDFARPFFLFVGLPQQQLASRDIGPITFYLFFFAPLNCVTLSLTALLLLWSEGMNNFRFGGGETSVKWRWILLDPMQWPNKYPIPSAQIIDENCLLFFLSFFLREGNKRRHFRRHSAQTRIFLFLGSPQSSIVFSFFSGADWLKCSRSGRWRRQNLGSRFFAHASAISFDFHFKNKKRNSFLFFSALFFVVER